MVTFPIMATIRALFANQDTSRQLRHRDTCLKQALHNLAVAAGVIGQPEHTYSDFADSDVHMHHHEELGLFQEPRDIAFALSTDGAQLTLKKQSDTWLLLIVLLNLPPNIRYRSGNTILIFATPGPKAPGNIESFVYPLFQEAAMASEGLWVWDAVDSSYFVLHAFLCMVLGDMLGSAKLSGMAGHTAVHGDRFSMVQAARSSLKTNSKSLYYPIAPPSSSIYNPRRPTYSLGDLPLRQEEDYWQTIEALQSATSKAAKATITRDTGVSRLPLCAASRAFLHPSFFPFDPFHLFYENILPHLWDLWVSSTAKDRIYIPEAKLKIFGQLIQAASSTLPPIFSGPIRDIYQKRQSQYKIYEWMAVLHWYLIPVGIELGFNSEVLLNVAKFVDIVEWAMTIRPHTLTDLQRFHQEIQTFLTGMSSISS